MQSNRRVIKGAIEIDREGFCLFFGHLLMVKWQGGSSSGKKRPILTLSPRGLTLTRSRMISARSDSAREHSKWRDRDILLPQKGRCCLYLSSSSDSIQSLPPPLPHSPCYYSNGWKEEEGMWGNARGKKGGEIELIKVKMRLLLEKGSSAKLPQKPLRDPFSVKLICYGWIPSNRILSIWHDLWVCLIRGKV